MTLDEIRQKLADFDVVPCRMFHEKVAKNPQTGLPQTQAGPDGITYTRVPLCPERHRRIGCAHTTANLKFAAILREVKDDDIAKMGTQFDHLISRIYGIDHEKGEAEKQLAILLFADEPNKNAIQAVREQISALEQQHDVFMADLAKLQKSILSNLDDLKAEQPGIK